MRILVTGSRTWDRPMPIAAALMIHSGACEGVTLVAGGAKGADSMAECCAVAYGWTTEIHYPDWDSHGKAAGFIRNQAMVDSGADICLAFTRGESRGTAHCALAAEQAGIPTIWIYYEAPDPGH